MKSSLLHTAWRQLVVGYCILIEPRWQTHKHTKNLLMTHVSTEPHGTMLFFQSIYTATQLPRCSCIATLHKLIPTLRLDLMSLWVNSQQNMWCIKTYHTETQSNRSDIKSNLRLDQVYSYVTVQLLRISMAATNVKTTTQF